MLKKYKLVVDSTSEIYPLLEGWADSTFTDFSQHTIIPNAVYVIDRTQFINNRSSLLELVKNKVAQFVLTNTHEGSDTLQGHVAQQGLTELIKSKQILLIGGGDMDITWPYLRYDSFLPKIYDYEENIAESKRTDEIYSQKNKPYKFLFLNGRIRPNRKYLLERFAESGLLEQSLWSNLDAKPATTAQIQLWKGTENLMATVRPARSLPEHYEVDRYQHRSNLSTNNSYIKFDLFDNDWGEIYLKAEPYIDTYFSLVTETVFEYPYSFRTEKIWKPIAMGHPWIAVANKGYYRDLQNLGFRTYTHIIDESFDLIDNNQQRIERIANIVEDLCQQDLAEFLSACYNVSKYNQQHLMHLRTQVRKEFPERFFSFINQQIT